MAQVGDKVRMLYEFAGIKENSELHLGEGDIVTLTNPDVGEGWWEGQSSDGSIGLFPSGYGELMNVGESEQAPSSTDVTYAVVGGGPSRTQTEETVEFDDDWDDNWPEQATYQTQTSVTQQQNSQSPSTIIVTPDKKATQKLGGESPKKGSKPSSWIGGINIFSSFTVTPGESYVLGDSKVDTSKKSMIRISATDYGPMWENSPLSFTCTISDPQKASKFSGFKSYITYNITSSHTGKTVSRRYKHFDWLLEQLSRKYGSAIAVLQLPDKQLTGRYEEDFIESRMNQLQGWISRMSLHPVISQSEVFQHFLMSKDNEKAWKDGKRKAEHDNVIGGTFYGVIEPPQERLEPSVTEQNLIQYSQFTKSLEDILRQTVTHGSEYARKCSGPLMREYQKMGHLFDSLGSTFAMDTQAHSQPLTEAIKHTGKTYEEIGTLYQNQSKFDWNPLLDGFNEYKRIVACFPNIIANNTSAIEKLREMVKQQEEGKYTQDDIDKARKRLDTVSYSVQAEMNHLQYYRCGDFAAYMKHFLEQQTIFYQTIVDKLQETAKLYETPEF